MGLGSGGSRLAYAFSPQPGQGALALHATQGTLGGGRSFRDNLTEAMSVVPLKKSGKFGEKSKKGSSYVRIFKCNDPAKTAYEFAAKATKGFVSMTTLQGKGFIARMADGTLVTYRYISSSKDRSPAVELRIKNLDRVKSQKIHFVARS